MHKYLDQHIPVALFVKAVSKSYDVACIAAVLISPALLLQLERPASAPDIVLGHVYR